MDGLSIRLLGSFCVQCGADVLTGLEAGKAQELFGYLLLHRNRTHSRERLAGVLWGDYPTAQARKHLRQSLWHFQSTLGTSPGFEIERYLTVSPDSVRFDAAPGVWLDIAVVEEAFASVRGVAGEALSGPQAESLRAAVLLYTGDLLEGWYQDWCVYARTALQHAYQVMLDKLMAYCEAHGAYEDGIAYGNEILRCDLACERTHRRLMRLHCLAGDRTGALRQYERCVAALDQELGVAPSRSTTALLTQIRIDQFDIPEQDVRPTQATAPTEPDSLPEVVQHLRQLQGLLVELHGQLQHDIHTLEVTQPPN